MYKFAILVIQSRNYQTIIILRSTMIKNFDKHQKLFICIINWNLTQNSLKI